MLRNSIYYQIKPFIPWRMRMAVRSWVARLRRARHQKVWPIDPSSVRRPPGWPGWPEGREFAVVLTHDVEGQSGVDRCMPLAELEASLGFRSSFNFIPEGTYSVTPKLRHWLTDHGFEVGVHDLHHDGKLYRSHDHFRAHAARINKYLHEWGAVGFRSGFMLHRLDWLHELDIWYDASTFDTDPFEPQPDGAQTIFPFWIQASADRGYLELPYTLPQDSTLFLLLRETTTDIWRRKLDWIAAHGGMALVNIHPDYVHFSQPTHRMQRLPATLMEAFLDDLRTRYAGRYWQPTARELAGFCREHLRPAESTTPV